MGIKTLKLKGKVVLYLCVPEGMSTIPVSIVPFIVVFGLSTHVVIPSISGARRLPSTSRAECFYDKSLSQAIIYYTL